MCGAGHAVIRMTGYTNKEKSKMESEILIGEAYGATRTKPEYLGMKVPDYIRDENGRPDGAAMLRRLQEEEYGCLHEEGVTVRMTEKEREEKVLAGKARKIRIEAECTRGEENAVFLFTVFQPYAESKASVVYLDFSAEIPNRYFPVEEMVDAQMTVAHVHYASVTGDDGDFMSGIAKLFPRKDRSSAGKIAMWAYAGGKVGKYLLEHGYAAPESLYIAGHSRLGKTALLAAAEYPYFCGVLSNCSGCSGAAMSRRKGGEDVAKIYEQFPYWFCEKYGEYSGREAEMPFDQHYLMAAIFPRRICIVTAEEDAWADTDAQYLTVELYDRLCREQGYTGLQKRGEAYIVGKKIPGDRITFVCRPGTHYLSRSDWNFFLKYIAAKS